jgi:uridine phosphorylase
MSISDLDKVLALSEKLIQQEELLKKIHNGEISQEEFYEREKMLDEEIADEKKCLIESWTKGTKLSEGIEEL